MFVGSSSTVILMVPQVKETGSLIGLSTSAEINVQKYVSMGFHKRGSVLVSAPTGDFYAHVLSRVP
jgi:hypothetical protein